MILHGCCPISHHAVCEIRGPRLVSCSVQSPTVVGCPFGPVRPGRLNPRVLCRPPNRTTVPRRTSAAGHLRRGRRRQHAPVQIRTADGIVVEAGRDVSTVMRMPITGDREPQSSPSPQGPSTVRPAARQPPMSPRCVSYAFSVLNDITSEGQGPADASRPACRCKSIPRQSCRPEAARCGYPFG